MYVEQWTPSAIYEHNDDGGGILMIFNAYSDQIYLHIFYTSDYASDPTCALSKNAQMPAMI